MYSAGVRGGYIEYSGTLRPRLGAGVLMVRDASLLAVLAAVLLPHRCPDTALLAAGAWTSRPTGVFVAGAAGHVPSSWVTTSRCAAVQRCRRARCPRADLGRVS